MKQQSQDHCRYCGEPIEQPSTGRRRKFCDNNNQHKMAYYRERRASAREAAVNQSLYASLALDRKWQQFDEATQVTLKSLAVDYDARAAALATLAVEQELQARTKKRRLSIPYEPDEDVSIPEETDYGELL